MPQQLRRTGALSSDAWFHAAADLNKEQGHGVHDGTTAPKVIKRWFQDHLTANIGSKTVCVILDIVDLDGEAAVGILQQAIWNGTAARTLW